MEVSGMEATKKTESHLTSAAAFVEGGIQEAYDDACSICLEAFCDSDPSTVTSCKHEFHLQCILEWCQRSLQCPMCWQSISLKDPTSQELLETIEREKSFRFNPQRNATIFHHSTLRDSEHLPAGANDTELEDYIIQRLAAAAGMGRTHRTVRRDGRGIRATARGHPQLLSSTHPNVPSRPVSASPVERVGDDEPAPAITATNPSVPLTSEVPLQGFSRLPSFQTDQIPASASGSSGFAVNQDGISFNNRNSASQYSTINEDRAGPSELQSFSESLKSRFNAVSMKYKESITKSTRGWKEKMFSRNTSMADIGSEVRREVTAGIASMSRLMERLDTRENSRDTVCSVSSNLEGGPVTEPDNQRTIVARDNNPNNKKTSTSCAVSSGSN